MALPETPLRLSNVFANSSEVQWKVGAMIPDSIHAYFFRHLFAGNRGFAQAMVSHFIQALYLECQAQGIPKVYDEHAPVKIAAILKNLNFNEPRSDGADSSTSKPKNKPTPSNSKRRRTKTDSGEVPNPKHEIKQVKDQS